MTLEQFIDEHIKKIQERLTLFEGQQKAVIDYINETSLPLEEETSNFLLRGRLRARVLEFFGPAILQAQLELNTLTRVLNEYKEQNDEVK